MERIKTAEMERLMKYVCRIRNTNKQAYARAYVEFLNGTGAVPHEGGFKIGVMARQAVRMNIHELIGR